MNNQEIRQAAKTANIRLWRIADKLGISDQTLCRRMRYELPEDEKQKILDIINELAKE